MGVPVVSVVAFAWKYVIPVLKDVSQVIMKGTYPFIKDRVDDIDVLELKGITKRTRVFADVEEFLKNKGVDPSMYSSAVIYLLIEIAVVNLKRKQKKLVK